MLDSATRKKVAHLFLPIYLTSFITATARAASIVVIPLFLLDQGVSASSVAFLMGLSGLGQFICNLPAGVFAGRFGDKASMLAGALCYVAGFALLAVSHFFWSYAAATFLVGAGLAFSMLGRMSYLTWFVNAASRGRAIALLGGTMRVGVLLGPAVSGVAVLALGYQAVFWILALLCCAALFLVLATASDEHASKETQQQSASAGAVTQSFFQVLRDYRQPFLRAGPAMIMLQLMRAARMVLLPLVGASLGLDAGEIGLVISLGAMLDVLMVTPAGAIMDRYGRRMAALPSLSFFAIGLFVMAMSFDWYSLLVAALLMGLGNGLSSGLVIVIGSDLAPEQGRARFLSVWKLIVDSGQMAGPLMVSGLLVFTPLAVATTIVGASGAAGALMVLFLMPETSGNSLE